VPNLPRQLSLRSPALVCFHEGGHAATAIAIGAKVQEITFFLSPTPHAKTRVDRTHEQGIFIACGGFAAEYYLNQKGRLLNDLGATATFDEWFAEANANAVEDKRNFSRAVEVVTGAPPTRLDEEFIATALTRVRTH
jgi:hypothetical protein